MSEPSQPMYSQLIAEAIRRLEPVFPSYVFSKGDDVSLSKVINVSPSMIDHTLLSPTATQMDIVRLAEEAKATGFASVCVNGRWVSLVAEVLTGTSVQTCTVVGFPLGAVKTSVKVFETTQAIQDGATEIDMVISIGDLKSQQWRDVYDDIAAVVLAAEQCTVKVILETCFLTDTEVVICCLIAKMAGAHFVKTSTGFGKGGASTAVVSLMRYVVGYELGVKASGGIRTREQALAMLNAGASRLGASRGLDLI